MVMKVLRGDFKQTRGHALEYISCDAPECASVKDVLMRRNIKPSKAKEKVKIMRQRSEARKEYFRNKPLPVRLEARRIVQCSLDGEVVAEWKNTFSAQSSTGITNIRYALYGIKESAGGYKWHFLIENA